MKFKYKHINLYIIYKVIEIKNYKLFKAYYFDFELYSFFLLFYCLLLIILTYKNKKSSCLKSFLLILIFSYWFFFFFYLWVTDNSSEIKYLTNKWSDIWYYYLNNLKFLVFWFFSDVLSNKKEKHKHQCWYDVMRIVIIPFNSNCSLSNYF